MFRCDTDAAARPAFGGATCRCLAWVLYATAVSAGCGSGDVRHAETAARFTPPPGLARDAVAALLDDWKAGRPPGPIDRLPVGVQVVDKRRRDGQVLDDYEILGASPGDAARCFAVRLKLSRPEAEEKVRYVVIGIDPLWVFRHEDFNSICQWECTPDDMADADTGATPDTAAAQTAESGGKAATPNEGEANSTTRKQSGGTEDPLPPDGTAARNDQSEGTPDE